jgi:hypothetical protein
MNDLRIDSLRHRVAARALATSIAALAFVFSAGALADGAKGTITYQSKSGPIVVNVKNAYLVKGPDMMAGKAIRRLVFSSADMGPKIGACSAMSCADGDLREGMTVDLDAGPRLNYWFVGNDQRVQYSGTARPEMLKLTTDTPQRVAGKLSIDDAGVGGAKADIEFDASLAKEFTKAR